MPRPFKQRRCREHDGDRTFMPRDKPMRELTTTRLPLSERKAMRPLTGGRVRVVGALPESRALRIEQPGHNEDLYTDER